VIKCPSKALLFQTGLFSYRRVAHPTRRCSLDPNQESRVPHPSLFSSEGWEATNLAQPRSALQPQGKKNRLIAQRGRQPCSTAVKCGSC
jgi:hypothetical protein